MTSRRLRGCLHAVMLLLPLLRLAAPAVAAPPPNIVFILTDDQRWDTIDATHSVDGQTPVMQNVTNLLVKKGVQFEKKDQFELGNVAGVAANASLIAIMADRLRELDPGWPGGAAARQPGSTPDENTDDDPE